MKLLQNVNCEVQAPSGTPSLKDEKAPKRVLGFIYHMGIHSIRV